MPARYRSLPPTTVSGEAGLAKAMQNQFIRISLVDNALSVMTDLKKAPAIMVQGITPINAGREEHRVGNLCTHSGFLLTMAIGVVAIGIAASLVAGEWHWFSRSGAIVVLIGVLMSARKCVRVGFEGLLQDATAIDCNPALQASGQKNAEKEHNQDISAAQRGIWVAVAGTLIWGFGDLPDLVASMNSGI